MGRVGGIRLGFEGSTDGFVRDLYGFKAKSQLLFGGKWDGTQDWVSNCRIYKVGDVRLSGGDDDAGSYFGDWNGIGESGDFAYRKIGSANA